jgi:hypothetical protein
VVVFRNTGTITQQLHYHTLSSAEFGASAHAPLLSRLASASSKAAGNNMRGRSQSGVLEKPGADCGQVQYVYEALFQTASPSD